MCLSIFTVTTVHSSHREQLFTDMFNRLQLTSSRSTPYNSQGNPKVERINQTLEDGLLKYCKERHEVWSVHLQSFMMAFRSAVYESNRSIAFRISLRERNEPACWYAMSNIAYSICWSSGLYFPKISWFSSIFNSVIQKNEWELRRQKAIFDKEARSFVQGRRLGASSFTSLFARTNS